MHNIERYEIQEKEKGNRVMKTDAQPSAIQRDPPPKKEGGKIKQCPFHELNGHTLKECLTFRAKSLEERTEWTLLSLPVKGTHGQYLLGECRVQHMQGQTPPSSPS